MELKNTENELNEMLIIYESLRRSEQWGTTEESSASLVLPALQWPENHPSRAVVSEHEANAAFHGKYASEEDLLTALEELHAKFPPLDARIQKFRSRLAEKDPITQAPRYGAKTAERVGNVLVLHGALKTATWAGFGLVEEEEEADNKINNSSAGDAPTIAATTEASVTAINTNSVVSKLRSTVKAQQEARRQAEIQAAQQRQQDEAQQRLAEEQQRQQEEAEQQQREEARRREEADLARRAEQVRQAQRQTLEAAAQAERDWIDSIPKGPQGVKQQIQILKDDTDDDPAAQKEALSALLVLFTQIAKHPEEINFRRIRRDHPKFHQDIGRHKGGREILIAAGFKLVTLDDIPCFFSKEPNLETDMDGWSDWFDNIKANLTVVKEMQ